MKKTTILKSLMALSIGFVVLSCNKENTPSTPDPQPKEYNRQTDSLALIAIYNASDGANWTKNAWDLTKPMSDWYGVGLDESGRVTKISFIAAGMITSEWELPAAIGDLKELTIFKISKALGVKGVFPAFLCSLPKLQTLYIENNNLSGSIPENLDNLTELQEFYVDNNPNLEGTIPASIGNLTKLKKFNISGTKVGGAVPTAMENCSALTDFLINNSQVTSIAIDWSKFTALANLSVYSTPTLAEPLPVSLGNMTTTASTLSIRMENCNFTGNVPESWGNLPNVTGTLRINGNKLAGVLPNAFTAHPKYAASTLWKAATYIRPQQDGYGLTEPVANMD